MKKLILILILFCITFISNAQHGIFNYYKDKYYVSNDGNDSNSGKYPWKAWKTLSKVNASQFAPGDQVLFKRGDMWRGETLVINWSGAANRPIVFGAYGTGANPIIDGADVITGMGYGYKYVSAWGVVSNEYHNNGLVYNFRNVVTPTQSGNTIVIRITGHNTDAATFDGVSIGTRSGATDDFSDTPVRVTFNGGDNFVNVAAGVTIYSDPIEFPVTAGINYIIHIYTNSSDKYSYRSSAGTAYFSTTTSDQTLTQTVTYSSSTAIRVVDALEVIQSTDVNIWNTARVLTQPKALWLNGTAGILQTSIANCDTLGQWFWDTATKVFYVYSTTDPSGDIELGQRTSLITLTNRTNITLSNLTVQHSNDPWVTGNGAAIRSTGGSDNLVVRGCTIQKNGYTGIYITDASNLTFDNNTIVSNGGHGLNVVSWYGGESGISFTNNTTNYNRFNNANFVTMNGSTPRLKNVTIHGNSFDNAGEAGLYVHMTDSVNIYNNTIDSSGWTTRVGAEKYAIGVEACSDVNIFQNTLSNTFGGHSSIEVYADTLPTSGSAHNVKIFRNYFSGAGKYHLLLTGTGNDSFRNFEFYSNVVTRSADWAIALTGAENGTRDTVNIYNNTFYNMPKGVLYSLKDWPVVLKNNIIYTSFANIIHASTVAGFLISSNNLWQSTTGGNVLNYMGTYTAATITNFEASAQTTDALFTDAKNGDFSLQTGSPAINAGVNVGLTTDILGNPIVGNPDIGAYERQ